MELPREPQAPKTFDELKQENPLLTHDIYITPRKSKESYRTHCFFLPSPITLKPKIFSTFVQNRSNIK